MAHRTRAEVRDLGALAALAVSAWLSTRHRRQRRFLTQGFEIGRRHALRLPGDLIETDADGWHPRGVEAEHCEASFLVRKAENDRSREPAAPHDRRIELVGPVGRADYEDAALTGDAVDLGEQLVDVAVVHLHLAATAGERIDLVNEDDRGAVLPGALEELADLALGLTDPFAHHIGAGDWVEGASGLGREDLRHAGLARPRGPGEQKPGGRVHTEPRRPFRILDNRLQLLQLGLDVLGEDQRVPAPVLDHRPILAAMSLERLEQVIAGHLQVLPRTGCLPEDIQRRRVDHLFDRSGRHPLGSPDELLDLDPGRCGAIVELSADDRFSRGVVREVDPYVPIEPTRPDHGWIQVLDRVGGGHHEQSRSSRWASNEVRSWLTVRRDSWSGVLSRRWAIESNSSKKSRHGNFPSAVSKALSMFWAEPPCSELTRSPVETCIKLSPYSPAIARAK